ncbi:MAG TPA: hypothetical protein VMT61_14750 [Candidatus Binataceae bacterium]|nr:hypothetical protein [Candidatus Binataceae bacterium]
MLIEQLNELEQRLAAGEHLDNSECAALLAELWRLKTSVASKVIERDVALDESSRLQAALNEANATIVELRSELELLKAIRDLGTCPLENRWTNCAVRMRKAAARK